MRFRRLRLGWFAKIVLTCAVLVVAGLSGRAGISAEQSARAAGGEAPSGATPVPGAVNNAPLAVPDSASVRKNTSVAINVLANDYDPDPDTSSAGQIDPTSVRITTRPARGRLVVSETGTLTYAPRRNFRGTDAFFYTVKDQEGAASSPAKVTITVK